MVARNLKTFKKSVWDDGILAMQKKWKFSTCLLVPLIRNIDLWRDSEFESLVACKFGAMNDARIEVGENQVLCMFENDVKEDFLEWFSKYYKIRFSNPRVDLEYVMIPMKVDSKFEEDYQLIKSFKLSKLSSQCKETLLSFWKKYSFHIYLSGILKTNESIYKEIKEDIEKKLDIVLTDEAEIADLSDEAENYFFTLPFDCTLISKSY